MYLRLLAINAYKQVPLKRAMSFENATVPLSLFTDDGEMISPTKSDFMHKLEEKVAEEITITVENVGCMLFDGMAVIQILQPETSKKTYRDMTNMFWKYIMSNSKGVKRVKMFLIDMCQTIASHKQEQSVVMLTHSYHVTFSLT